MASAKAAALHALQATTPIMLGATAGLRLLPEGKADKILDAVKKWLGQFAFNLDKKSGVTILDGELASPRCLPTGCLSCTVLARRQGLYRAGRHPSQNCQFWLCIDAATAEPLAATKYPWPWAAGAAVCWAFSMSWTPAETHAPGTEVGTPRDARQLLQCTSPFTSMLPPAGLQNALCYLHGQPPSLHPCRLCRGRLCMAGLELPALSTTC